MTRVLGVDPGSASAGYCLLDVPAVGRARWLDAGHVDATPRASLTLLDRLAPDLVCIEEPIQAGNVAAVEPLLLTAWNGGGWEYLAESRGIPVRVLFAREWRIALTRAPSPSTKIIKWYLPRVVDGVPARSDVHERDACGIAWWGAKQPAAIREIRREQARAKLVARGRRGALTKRMNRAGLAKAVGR